MPEEQKESAETRHSLLMESVGLTFIEERTERAMIAGKDRPVRVKVYELDYEGEKQELMVKKLPFGERAAFGEKFVKIQMMGAAQKVELSMERMQIEGLKMGLYKAPFEITEDYIVYSLDGALGEVLYKEIDEFNSLNPKKKSISPTPSDTEAAEKNSTETSPTSASTTTLD